MHGGFAPVAAPAQKGSHVMEGLVMLAAAGAVVLILVWLFGSGLARFAGIVLVIDGLGGLVIHAGSFDNPRYAIEAAAGIGLWMFGHWLFALKHGMWRTRLGRAAWRVPVWSWASPVRG